MNARHRTAALFLVGAVAAAVTLGLSTPATALGLRAGGSSLVSPESDTKFAVGLENDMWFAGVFALNSGSLFVVDGDALFIDAYLGVKIGVPVAMAGRLKVTAKADFMARFFYPFEEHLDSGLALGGNVGPGVMFAIMPPLSLSFDLDVLFYKFVYPSVYSGSDWQVALSFLLGVHF